MFFKYIFVITLHAFLAEIISPTSHHFLLNTMLIMAVGLPDTYERDYRDV